MRRRPSRRAPGPGPSPPTGLGSRDADRPSGPRWRANAEILADLRGGAAAAIVRIDPTGKAGAAIGSARRAWPRAGGASSWSSRRWALDAGFPGPGRRRLARRRRQGPRPRPSSASTSTRSAPMPRPAPVPGPIEGAPDRRGQCRRAAGRDLSQGLAVSSPPAGSFHEAGGGEAGEIAFAAAAAVAYAKALVRAGLPMGQGFRRDHPRPLRRWPTIS